jgi:RNA polymerase sigma factor (sigma-70 family)
MEAATLPTRPSVSRVRSRPARLRRMQTDERLVALVREGDHRAFELLVNRYQPRLLAYCRRMVGSPQDAEDVLQEVFAAAHAGILAHDRPINAGPWLYRIARNRCVNHLRRGGPATDGVDSMDVHPHENGTSTLERVQQREELRAIVADVHELPKTQRTALVLRQIDDLSYTDVSRAMGKSLPSVKSLLIRARMSLAESSAGRAALAPFALMALLRKLIPAKLGGGSSAGGTAGVAASAGSAGGAAGTAGGVVSAAATGLGGAIGAKAAVGVATAALITAGAMSVDEVNLNRQHPAAKAGQTRIAAIPGAEDGFGLAAASRSAGPAADNAVRRAGSTPGLAPGRRRGLAADHLPAKPGHPAVPAKGVGSHLNKPLVGGRHLGQVAGAVGGAVGGLVPSPAVPSQPAAGSGGGDVSPKPPKVRVLPTQASPGALTAPLRERVPRAPLDGIQSPLG